MNARKIDTFELNGYVGNVITGWDVDKKGIKTYYLIIQWKGNEWHLTIDDILEVLNYVRETK